ncbi:hypothetical protein MMC21_005990 [Puttea exsequens]|nr:hypothetical protein [Puttea exsequens]
MFRWLTGPGQVFKNPLPGSTNYLNAYDRSGNLIRARRIDSREDDAASASAAKETTVDDEGREFESEDAGREKEKDKGKGKERGQIGLPREKQEDLMPFPMNRQFQSQPVLSEEFKDAIWKRIREEGRSVRDVSAMMGVEMRRVAAVVRLKEVERNWEAEVCFELSFFSTRLLACFRIGVNARTHARLGISVMRHHFFD